MEAKASVKYLRIGPQKVRNIFDLVRKQYTTDAFDILSSLNKKGARYAEELLKSAVANAKVKKMDESSLFIDDIRADGGPIMKRFMSRSMGRADRLLKRTSHMSIRLIERPKTEVSAVTDDSAADTVEKTGKTKTAKKIKNKKEAPVKKEKVAKKTTSKKK